MPVPRLTIRTRLYGGFGALVVISLVMGGFGVMQLGRTGAEVTRMTGTAGELVASLQNTAELELIRRAENRFRLDGDKQSFEEIGAATVRTAAVLSRSMDTAASPELRAIFKTVRDQLQAHAAAVAQFGELTNSALAARKQLFTGGDALTAATDELVAASDSSEEAIIRDVARQLERAVLLTRIANWRFLATNDANGPATFTANAAKARAALDAGRRSWPGPEQQALVPPVARGARGLSQRISPPIRTRR